MSKIQMKIVCFCFFCQHDSTQCTRVLKENMKALEKEILKQSSANNTSGDKDAIERNKLPLRNLLEEHGKGSVSAAGERV